MTLKARAYRPDLNPSPTTSAQYFLYVGLSFDPAVGPITNQTQVKIKASTSGVTIRYTLDGSDPADPASTPALYSGPLLLDGNTTLKAVGFKDGFDYSGTVSQFYGWGNYQNLAIRTLAGNGIAGYRDGAGTSAQFNYPQGICVDASGNVFVADTGNNMVRKISPQGEVTTFAGTGVAGFQDGPAQTSMFSSPSSVSIDSAGNLYVADVGNHRIRLIDTNFMVITYAGTGASAGDDGPRLNATFGSLTQTAINSRGDLYVGDWARLRKIWVEGNVTTVAGPGNWCCGWSGYVGVGVDSIGNPYVGVSGGPVRIIDSTGADSIFAGGIPGHADGPRLLAQFDSNFYINSFIPRYLGGDNLGNLFVSDRNWIRKIDTNGIVSTLASVSRLGTSAPPPFGFAMGVCVDNAGNVYASDILNHTVRKMSPDTDFDGIPDAEEGGMTPFVSGRDDGQIDSDGDGMSNAAEYIAGTDPTDKNSVLHLQVSLGESNHVTISWTSVLGRTYRLQSSNDLENWTGLTTGLPGTGETMSTDEFTSNARFYRLSMDLQ